MNLLAGVHYDPAGAVSKATSALLAMTAFDTTNLRVTFTVPPSGIVRVRMQTNLSGATTMPQVLLGVLDGSTVEGRQVAMAALPGTALATTNVPLVAEFLVTGLTPGTATTWDAAYGVEIVVAATNIHYGGPNDTTTNNAWGGFSFEVWDPCPIYNTDAVPTTTVNARIPSALVSGRMDSSVGAAAANTITASALATDAVNEIADGVLDRDMSTGTDSGSTTVRTMRQALRFLRNKWTVIGGVLTVYKENDSTTSWQSTLGSTTGADPITSSDPDG